MILWLNPFSGISGDMLLGALLDLGAPLEAVRSSVASTGITGWELRAGPVSRQGLRACRAQVSVTGNATPRRPAAELLRLVSAAQPAPVAHVAATAVAALAQTEGHLHGVSPDEVILHELGGIDTVVDTVGVAAAAHALNITGTWSAPVALGAGTVQTAHGLLPSPAPATLSLLAGAQVTACDDAGETVTPTGAALLRALGCRYEPMPPMTVAGAGYGAGSRDTPGRPNVLPAVLGQVPDDPGEHIESLVMLETTTDDVTGEILAVTMERLLDAGALDAWISPMTGKKGRPGHVISVLCRPSQAAPLQRLLLAETGSLGARRHPVQRHALPRTIHQVTVDGQTIRVKTGPHRAKPELDDVQAASTATGLPLQVITERAITATHRPHEHPT